MLHALHAGSCGSATHRCFEAAERRFIATGRNFDVAGAGVPDPAGDTELLRPFTYEPPESYPLHSSNNAEVDDRHV